VRAAAIAQAADDVDVLFPACFILYIRRGMEVCRGEDIIRVGVDVDPMGAGPADPCCRLEVVLNLFLPQLL
jgi:hypothetical protein